MISLIDPSVRPDKPEEFFYGIDCGLRDPFGNGFRLTQIADGPAPVPSD